MTELQSYLTLSEAARKYGVSSDVLTRLARDGIIRAIHNEEGTAVITVQTVDNATAVKIILDEIRPEQYEHLRGKRIRLMEAVRKYEINHGNLQNWATSIRLAQHLNHSITGIRLPVPRGCGVAARLASAPPPR